MSLLNTSLIRFRWFLLFVFLPLILVRNPNISYAESIQELDKLRAAFPGRRIGGGTRGECSSRPLIHLVPYSSTFYPGELGLVAFLKRPSDKKTPVEIFIHSYNGTNKERAGYSTYVKREIMPSNASVVLLKLPVSSEALVWESSFICSTNEKKDLDDPFDFIEKTSPPAVTLILPPPDFGDYEVGPGKELKGSWKNDRVFSENIKDLALSCGKSISAKDVSKRFLIEDIITPKWSNNLLISCPIDLTT